MIQTFRESIETPGYVAHALERAGGLNRFGEPNYRCVWGWSRLSWIGGEWFDRGRTVVEERFVPKYLGFNRWHIERWTPPEAYGSPRYWRLTTTGVYGRVSIPELGPYPERGEYELSFTIESPAGEFVPLTPTIVRTVAWSIEWSRGKSEVERKMAVLRRECREAEAIDKSVDDILDMDPLPVSRERQEFLDRRIVPQLDVALQRADERRRNRTGKPRESRYHASAGVLTR